MTSSSLTHEDVTQTLRLVEELPDGELVLTKGDFSLTIRKGMTGAGAPAPVAAARSEPPAPAPTPQTAQVAETREAPAPASSPADVASDEGHFVMRAPMLGCFYRAASPDEPPLADVGSHVAAGDTVCLIEVMKLFNTIGAEISGRVVAVHAENGAMVDAGAPLFTIMPD